MVNSFGGIRANGGFWEASSTNVGLIVCRQRLDDHHNHRPTDALDGYLRSSFLPKRWPAPGYEAT